MEPPIRMSQDTKTEYLELMRFRYHGRGRVGKSRLLDELVAVCGYERKHANKLMNMPLGITPKEETRSRRAIYGSAERDVLKAIWLAANQPCGKLLQPMIEIWLPHFEGENSQLSDALRKNLKSISARSIDRLLAPVKASENRRRNGGTKPGTLIKSQIPIRTDKDDIDRPGFESSSRLDAPPRPGGRQSLDG